MDVLEVTHLSCIRQHKTLFTDLNFTLNAGDILLIEGENGSGKSSLLRLLTGLSTPQCGSIFWRRQSIQQLGTRYGQDLHYLSHQNGLKSELTVKENLQLTAELHANALTAFEHTLALLQLNAYQNYFVHQLSAGQKRRLALAKLILFPKTLWILDEPLTSLDTATQQVFLSQLEAHRKKGGIAIISSHHPFLLNAHTLRLGSC